MRKIFGEMKKLLEYKSIKTDNTIDFFKHHELIMKLKIFTVVVYIYH